MRPFCISVTKEYLDDQTYVLKLDDRPSVALVEDRVFKLHGPIVYEMLRLRGYRAAERHPEFGGGSTAYVRPLPRWVLHRVGGWLQNWFYNYLGWALDRGIMRVCVSYEQNTVLRLRDLRLWPFGKAA